MSVSDWKLLIVVHSLDKVKTIAKSNGVCQYRTHNLVGSTEFSFKCSQYRKYPIFIYELKATVSDDDPNSITIMFKNAHSHEYRNDTTRLPSPVRQSVAKYVEIGFRSAFLKEHPNIPVPSNQLTAIVQTERRRNRVEIFSVFDFQQWCDIHRDGSVPHSTFVSYYFINDINDLFVLFTTKQLIRRIQQSPLIQIDATYKVTWNELPLLVFGASDCKRNFKPFGVALVSEDEDASCYEHLFNSLRSLSIQELHQPYYPRFVMADGAPGITAAQNKRFPNSKHFMCWFHIMQKCRVHRNLMTQSKWKEVDKEIHDRADSSVTSFYEYFKKQWTEKLPSWYEGSALNLPSTNNGCESFNAKIKREYTLRNKLHLSSFLPKIESMLEDWSKDSDINPFAVQTPISSENELAAYEWSMDINRSRIHHWYNNFYVVPSSSG
ncbi:unnamed protein product [Adineta ricciae]|uniref:MULE transposase domain-containing protein n=1 Tax=Adineta ricciae TaxID=249248 RepID=A0A816EAN4_ADIRI|nr:unnamed protein product [Adineta ricciae]CAF1647476.1 unnamed protein product [Adineta ricciae]